MPNWCLNEITVTSHPEDKDKLKALMFDPETGELDFELASPCPKALQGMFLGSKEKVSFNKAMDERTSLLTVDEFISSLRLKNKEKGAINRERFAFIRNHISNITDKQIIKKDYTDVSEAFGDDVFEAELLFIDELGKELTSHPLYTPTTPVEDVLEDIINSHIGDIDGEQKIFYNIQYVWHAVNKCSSAVKYALEVLKDSYSLKCITAYGSSDSYDWYVENWGTKWNAYEVTPSEDFTHAFFETAWSPPIDWLKTLAVKVEEAGIRDFNATLKYAEGGIWFGGEFFIAEPDDYWDEFWFDDDIKEFLGIESDLDDDSEEEMEEFDNGEN